jgi:hypothetical protein
MLKELRNRYFDMAEEGDPEAIRSIVITVEDVATAYEARQRSPRRPVLRVTPPFSGRMRARLHDPGPSSFSEGSDTDLDPETGAVHVPPGRLLAEDAIPPYPSPDDTEDALREDPDAEFTVDAHRERHVAAVEEWREAVRDGIAASAELRLSGGPRSVDVKTLGGSSGG